MPRRRSAETMEKDAQAYDLFRRGLSYRQIAQQMGYKSQSAAFDAVRRAAKDNALDPLEAAEARQAFYDRFQDYRRTAQRVLSTRHYLVTKDGKLVDGPDGKYLLDPAPVMAALNALVKIDDTELRLRGLYPAVKHEVRAIDAIDARLLDLADQVGGVDAGPAEVVPKPA